jgi:hypothetical protein
MAYSTSVNIDDMLDPRKNDSSAQKAYEKVITLLTESLNKDNSAPIHKTLIEAIAWYRSEREKPVSLRADDITYQFWGDKINEAFRYDILKKAMPILQYHFEKLNLFRNQLKFILMPAKILKKYALPQHQTQHTQQVNNARQEYKKALNALLDFLRDTQDIIKEQKTAALLKEVILWIENDAKKPLPKQEKNNAYSHWKKRLYLQLSTEIKPDYFSRWEKIRLLFLKLSIRQVSG